MAPLTQSSALDRPSSNILTKIFAFAIPVLKLVIKDLNRVKWPKKPFEKVLLRNFSNHAREIDAALYSRLTFNFMSVTPRSGEILDGCDVAKAFFGAMRPRQRWLIRDINCDLNWHKKGRAEDTVFPVLAKLMNHPVNHITFEVIPAPDANHLPRGIKSIVGVKIVIFVVNLARPPAAEPFAERMSRWIGRDYRIPRLDFFALPLEMRNVVYRNFLPKQHLITRVPAITNISSIVLTDFLRASRCIRDEVFPLLYGGCQFEFVACRIHPSAYHNSKGNTTNGTASRVLAFLHTIKDNREFVKRIKIVLPVPFSEASYRRPRLHWVMPIKHIVDAFESYCSLEIAERFLAGPCANIPIAAIIGGPRTRKQCFHNVLPTKMGTEIIVEIQTKWQYEQDGSPRHALQLDLIRQLYWSSITAMPFRLRATYRLYG